MDLCLFLKSSDKSWKLKSLYLLSLGLLNFFIRSLKEVMKAKKHDGLCSKQKISKFPGNLLFYTSDHYTEISVFSFVGHYHLLLKQKLAKPYAKNKPCWVRAWSTCYQKDNESRKYYDDPEHAPAGDLWIIGLTSSIYVLCSLWLMLEKEESGNHI